MVGPINAAGFRRVFDYVTDLDGGLGAYAEMIERRAVTALLRIGPAD